MLSAIMSFLGGGVVKELAAAYRAKQDAATDAERIAADERIAQLQAMVAVQKAEAGWFFTAAFRVFFSMPAALYIWQTVFIDKIACKWIYGSECATDPLSSEQWFYVYAVIGYWLVVLLRRK